MINKNNPYKKKLKINWKIMLKIKYNQIKMLIRLLIVQKIRINKELAKFIKNKIIQYKNL